MNKQKPSLEENQPEDLLQNAAAREIVQEIMNFGVNQSQILQIINLLALELEDNNMMRSIIGLVKSNKMEKLHV